MYPQDENASHKASCEAVFSYLLQKGSFMCEKTIKLITDNIWYVFASLILAVPVFFAYGMQSKCPSLINPDRKVTRDELQNELNYLIGQAKVRAADLDRQDEIKQQLLDAPNIIAASGGINASGILNLFASVGGIAFGLQQRKKLTDSTKKNNTNTA